LSITKPTSEAAMNVPALMLTLRRRCLSSALSTAFLRCLYIRTSSIPNPADTISAVAIAANQAAPTL
jgi:hypothetical protein